MSSTAPAGSSDPAARTPAAGHGGLAPHHASSSDEEHQPTANRSPAQSAGLNAHLPEHDRQPVLTSARDTGSGYGSHASLDVSSPPGGRVPPTVGSVSLSGDTICNVQFSADLR